MEQQWRVMYDLLNHAIADNIQKPLMVILLLEASPRPMPPMKLVMVMISHVVWITVSGVFIIHGHVSSQSTLCSE